MGSTSSKVHITSGKSPANSIAKELLCIKDLLEISCELDVHKDKIVACILTDPLGKPTHSEIREFFGASDRNVILHLVEHGQIDRAALDTCIKTKTRNRIDEILMSVNGTLSEHQKTFLKILMGHYDSLKEHRTEIEKSLEADMIPFALQVNQLSSIYGISTTASCAIIAEIGIDMKPLKRRSISVHGQAYVPVIIKAPGNAKAPLSQKAIRT